MLGIVASSKSVLSPDANTNDEDLGPTIGKYLPKASVSPKKKDNKEGNVTEDDNDLMAAVPDSRLPPPPKQTTFGDFSGW